MIANSCNNNKPKLYYYELIQLMSSVAVQNILTVQNSQPYRGGEMTIKAIVSLWAIVKADL